MANNQKEDIFYLIKKLSKTEIRQFKKTSTIQDGQITDYIKLFEEIELQEEYNEELILQKLNKTQPQLSRIKNYLFEKIVNYLNEIYQDEENLIQTNLKSYDTFVNIDLPELGFKYLLEAKKIATKYSRNQYLNLIQNKEIEYYKNTQSLNDKIIEDYSAKGKKTLELLNENFSITNKLISQLNTTTHFIYVAAVKKTSIKLLPENDYSEDSLLELNYYEYLRNSYHNKGDLFNAILISANIIEHVLEKKLNPNLFFKHLGTLLDELLVTKRVKDFTFFEKKVISFFNSFTESQKIHFKSEYNFCLFKCRFYIARSRKDEVLMTKVVNDYSEIFSGEQKISNQLLFFYLCKANLLFINGEYKKVVDLLSVFRQSDLNIETQLYFEATILEVAARLKNKEEGTFIESMLRSLNKFIKKIEGDTEFEKITINSFNKLNMGHSEKLKKNFDELRLQLTDEANQKKTLFYTFSAIAFLEDRVYGRRYNNSYFNR